MKDVRRTTNGKWFVRAAQGWLQVSLSEVSNYLLCKGLSRDKITKVIGGCVAQPWQLINRPFQPEDFPGRQWNRNAPQFAVQPVAGNHPTWDRLLRHLGTNLPPNYLACWIAYCLRKPFNPLPLLFFYGGPCCGKSTFHRAIRLLVTSGVVQVDRTLTDKKGFNDELANAVIGVVEQTDFSRSLRAYGRFQDWVTSRDILIRPLYEDAYTQPNSLHFIMCANKPSALPVSSNNTRVTAIEVPDLKRVVPMSILTEQLKEETPHFLHTLMNMELPAAEGRLQLPAIYKLEPVLPDNYIHPEGYSWLLLVSDGDASDYFPFGYYTTEQEADKIGSWLRDTFPWCLRARPIKASGYPQMETFR